MSGFSGDLGVTRLHAMIGLPETNNVRIDRLLNLWIKTKIPGFRHREAPSSKLTKKLTTDVVAILGLPGLTVTFFLWELN